MTKWADYVVTGVKYSAGDLHVQSVEVREHEGNKLVRPRAMTRPEVVDLLAKGKTFVTATLNKEKNTWSQGAPLQIIKVETRFIKTKADKTEKDNLESLPPF
jgi:hypothetical protein